MKGRIFIVVLIMLSSGTIIPQEFKYYDYVSTNNLIMWVGADGRGSHDPNSDGSGLYWDSDGMNYPSNYKSTIFADGPVFGFRLNDVLHVHASTYKHGFKPEYTGIFYDNKLYCYLKMATNWQDLPDGELKNYYQYQFDNYPVQIGAPYLDLNVNGIYDPKTIADTPRYRGDEMIWFVNSANDSVKAKWVYSSPPANLVVQTTVWVEKELFPDVVYKEYLFINKEDKPFTDFYFSYWSDPDNGNANDDVVGSDTTLGMNFCYNGDNDDNGNYGTRPASVGYLVLDGPVAEGMATDTARNSGYIRPGKINLKSSSMIFYNGGSIVYQDPDLGEAQGAIQMYNYQKGKLWNGDDYINPHTNEPSLFPLDGDPIAGTGWYELEGWPDPLRPGDRKMMLNFGPFELAPGDTNCVTIAIVNSRGNDRLASLANLKALATDVKYHWLYETERGIQYPPVIPVPTDTTDTSVILPDKFTISNNYPNPFNGVTNINLELPQSGNIKVRVYNSLGEVVKEILEHAPTAGNKSIQFSGAGLSSGVYYYTVLFRDETKLDKFVLLK